MKSKLLTILLTFFSFSSFAQKDPIEQNWYNQEKSSKIQIYKAIDGKYYGKIIWLKRPNEKNGEPRKDINNQTENQRDQPLNGLLILQSFEKSTNIGEYINGTIYDPNNGKNYCGKIKLYEKSLKLRGNICGLSFLGRSTAWSLAEQ